MFSLLTNTKAKLRYQLSDAAVERQRVIKIRRHMIDRCTKPEHPAFADYGDRGITVCERWLESASAFVEDVGQRPPGMTLERIDNAKGYEPGNVRWATRAEQVRNRRNNIFVEVSGERMVLKDACARLGISYDAVWRRIKRGMPVGHALKLPVKKRALTPELAALIRSQLAAGRRQCEVASDLRVSRGAVSDVFLGKTYANH